MIEWIVANSWVTWLVVFLILAIIEMMTLDLFFIMMSSGALVALFAALLGLPFWLQVVIFCVVALLMVLFVRPVALRHLHRGPRDLATNVDRLIGESAIALESVTDHSGVVKIGGDTWTRQVGGRIGHSGRPACLGGTDRGRYRRRDTTAHRRAACGPVKPAPGRVPAP